MDYSEFTSNAQRSDAPFSSSAARESRFVAVDLDKTSRRDEDGFPLCPFIARAAPDRLESKGR